MPSSYCTQAFFSCHLDLLIIVDCRSRFIMICYAHQASDLLKFRRMLTYLVGTHIISALYAFLCSRMKYDVAYYKGDEQSFMWMFICLYKSSMVISTGLVCVWFTLRIRSSLKKSILFLTETRNNHHGVVQYKKIMWFCTVICAVFVVFHSLMEIPLVGLEIAHNLEMFSFVKPTYFSEFLKHNLLRLIKLTLKAILLFRPFGYSLLYIIFKVRREIFSS